MSLTLGQTAAVVIGANKDSAKTATGIIAGNIINGRLAKLVVPRLPVFTRGYADTPMGHAVLANIAAGALIHFLPTNKRAQQASAAMIEAAMVTFASSFEIESLVDELLDGVAFPEATEIKNKFTGMTAGDDENAAS